MGKSYRSLKEIILRLIDYHEQIQLLEDQRAQDNLRASQSQSLNLQLREAKLKYKNLHDELLKKLSGEVIIVEYLLEGKPFYGRLINLSDQEIRFLYDQLSRVSGKEIKILEIRRLSTFFSRIRL